MSAPVTEAHRKLVAAIIRDLSIDDGAQLIADSEARACAWALWAITCTHHTDKQRAECPVCLITALTSERGKLRAEVEAQCLLNGKGAEREADLLGRLERAEREVERLKADGAASAFVAMACRASRAETDRNNLRADKARLDWLEKARPIAWALGSEECGEYWILTDTGEKHPEEAEEFATLRAAIDAAMKEETK